MTLDELLAGLDAAETLPETAWDAPVAYSPLTPWLAWLQITHEERDAFWADWTAYREEIALAVDRALIATWPFPQYFIDLDYVTYAHASVEAWEQRAQRRDECEAGHALPEMEAA